MRINKTSQNFNNYKFSFKSIRTDKKQVEVLQNGTKPISENKKINILNSLNNLAASPEKANIEFLLSVADNLVYGQNGDSEFKSVIDSDDITPENRENTDWSKILEETILKAINNSEDEDVADLQAEYARIYSSKKELTPVQEEILALRKDLSSVIHNEKTLDDVETLLRRANIIKNIDYFVASSEIPSSQKKECLEKFLYLLSDEYKINPQLENRKLQVVDEMLNDMLIKTPEDDVLTIKDVDQRASGICAAISICRKAVAYEDKVQYMNIVLEELSNKDTMDVFDVTELGTGKKVTVNKPQIDYDSSLAKGYRILDSAAHIWMQNAHTGGDGSILTEAYTAFDDESYNIYDDASWYEGLDANYQPAKKMLKALIKEREFLKAIDKRLKNSKDMSQNINDIRSNLVDEQSKYYSKLGAVLSSVFNNDNFTSKKTRDLIASIQEFFKGKTDDNEVKLPEKLPLELREKILANFIKEQVPSITKEQEEKLALNAKSILDLTSAIVETDEKISKMKQLNTNRSKYRYYRNLFQAAAAHRLAVEADVNLPDGVMRYEKISHLSPKDIRVLQYLNTLKNSFSSENVRAKYSDIEGNIPTKEELELDITGDMIELETNIPKQMNDIVSLLYGKDFNILMIDMAKNIAQSIAMGDEEMLTRFSDTLQLKKDKTIVLDAMKKYVVRAEKNPSSENIQEVVRLLGFEDRMEAANIMVSNFYAQLQQGITEDLYNQLVTAYGGQDALVVGLETTKNHFEEIYADYQAIQEKWTVPSSRTAIIDRLEQNNFIVSRKKLDKLKSSFDRISSELVQNEKIEDLKARKKANEKACKFTPDELEVIDQIEKSLPKMRKYSKNAYKDINQYMFDALEAQYSYIGMLNGQFWVREEGSSGLSSNEQVRIIEQMTGKPYHIESDVQDAAKLIKEGNGSGILSTSVDDKDYAFHAQYIPQVTSETFVDPVTKKVVTQDVLWTDNSWGRSEMENFWNGYNGHYYTDYDRGFGWKDGFILDKSFRIGQPVKDMHCAVGFANKGKDKFGLFGDIVLSGTPTDTYQKLYKMFNHILNMNEGVQYLNNLENAIKSGHKLDVDFLVGIDDSAEKHSELLEGKLEKINSEEEYNKLPDDDEIKLVMNKLSLYFSTVNPQLRDSVYSVKSMQEIEDLKEEFIDAHIKEFISIIAKSEDTIENMYVSTAVDITSVLSELEKNYGVKLSEEETGELFKSIFFDEEDIKNHDGSLKSLKLYFIERISKTAEKFFENEEVSITFFKKTNDIVQKYIEEELRINSLDDLQNDSHPLKLNFIAAVDKYLEPKSDEELLALIQGLQEADFETVEGFVDALEPEDIGLNFKPPYDYLRRYQLYDSAVVRAFSEIVGTGYISSELSQFDDDTEATPEDLYRILHVKLADMDVQKYVKKFKSEAFAKYKLRQAFPQPLVFSDKQIIDSVNDMLETFQKQVGTIKGNQFVLELLSKKDKFLDKYQDMPLYKALANGENVNVEQYSSELKELKQDATVMYEFVSQDKTLSSISSAYSSFIKAIDDATDVVDTRKTKRALKKISEIFADWEATGATELKFEQNVKENLDLLNENIKVFVASTVEPKYQDEAISKIRKLINMYRKDATVDELDDPTDEFTGFILNRHITKNPTVLLKETVKYMQAGKTQSDEYQILKSYLESALKIAQQTKVQYKLVQNQHEGIGSKTKEMLPLFYVKMMDGSSQPMDSPTGMLYIVEQLRNQSDNNVTLNLFLEQSGLAEKTLDAMIDTYDIEKSVELVKETANEVMSYIEGLAYIGQIIDEYLEKSRIKYNSFDDAFKHISNYVSRKTKNLENQQIVEQFITYMSEVSVKETDIPTNSQMFKDVVALAVNNALEYFSDLSNAKIQYLEQIPQMLAERTELLYAINVSDTSHVSVKRDEFAEKYNETMEEINKILTQVYQVVTASQVTEVG